MDEPIIFKSDQSSNGTLWITLGAAALIAYFLPKLLASRKPEPARSRDNEEVLKGTRKSRLLEEKFGSLLVDGQHDLQLEPSDGKAVKNAGDVACKDAAFDDSSTTSIEEEIPEKNSPQPKTKPQTNKIKKKRTVTDTAKVVVRPPFHNTTDRHPGLETFRYWWDVQTSLYRIYTLTRANGQPSDPPPYNPSSRRGKTSVDLRVTNDTLTDINVYWINYTGGHEPKGTIAPGSTWTQSTWIDHPWVFANAKDDAPIAHYIPYKVIPNVIPEAPTVELPDDADDTPKQRLIGIQRFSIVDTAGGEYTHWVRDDILPLADDIRTEPQALDITLLHCVRTGYFHWNTLLQYIRNIQKNPDDPKYRQIRIANRTFFDCVWNTPARGVLHCTGWVEHGAYVELGTSSPYTRSLSEIIDAIERWKKRAEEDSAPEQPEGADGFGRAGYQ